MKSFFLFFFLLIPFSISIVNAYDIKEEWSLEAEKHVNLSYDNIAQNFIIVNPDLKDDFEIIFELIRLIEGSIYE